MSKKKVINIFNNIDMSEEAVEKRFRESFDIAKTSPENMSYWFPKIKASQTALQSELKLPKTKVIPFTYEEWRWLRSDLYTEDKISEFNASIVERLGYFMEGETLFMKTGVFSNKFEFWQTVIKDKTKIGKQFLDMYYTSMIYGADNTAEVVFREFIDGAENRLSIYGGMPLRTEFRVFYDFDKKQTVGVSNYWHPEVMKKNLKDQNALNYRSEESKIIFDFDLYKNKVMSEVHTFMKGTTGLTGKWSVDVMKVGNEFWLIDMARMERSALVQQMEEV